MLISKKKIKILDFDIENRPLSYWIPDQPTAEITAIAYCWSDDLGSLRVTQLGVDDPVDMLEDFIERYNEADMVTGHYIRRHDLPIINGALMEYGIPKLSPKLTCDTRVDLIKKLGIPATQEYLCEILGITIQKEHMTQHDWRKANRLLEKGLERSRKRVTNDVLQHMLLRVEMVKLNWLSQPKMWMP